MTCGTEASNFDELLAALASCKETEKAELDRINQLFWSYSDENDCERIINTALSFTPEKREFPKLYSFDIFDTLFSRQCCHPSSVFDNVRKNWSSLTVAMTAILSANFRRFAAGANPMCVSFIKSRY